MSNVVLFIFALLALVPTLKSQDLKQKTCGMTLYKDVCTEILSKSLATDIKGLATDAAKALVTVGEDSQKKVEAAKPSVSGPALDQLNACFEMYKKANSETSVAVERLGAGNATEAVFHINTAVRIQRSCEEGFKTKNIKNPVPELHSQWAKLANVVVTICTFDHRKNETVPVF